MIQNVPTTEKIILGIDPGTNYMGYGVIKVVNRKAEFITMGVIDLHKVADVYLKLAEIYKNVLLVVDKYLPDELAIESPYIGVNIQSTIKLGRAQGVAMAAALARQVPIKEYTPRKIKMAITGNGNASKEQVAGLLSKILNIPQSLQITKLDATDALAIAYCHYLQMGVPSGGVKYSSWKEYAERNPKKVK